MERRDFFGRALGAGMLGAAPLAAQTGATGAPAITIDKAANGTPHRGKVLALITPHLDDGPIFAFGTIAKLLKEGYTGHFIRTSNDEKDSYDLSPGETMLANERDAQAFVKTVGLERLFDLGYRNHAMDEIGRTEIRSRLIFLFRLLKVDTVFSYDPSDHYEENPDHYVTAQAVEAACWMAGHRLDYPEHFAAGLKPHAVQEKYYFARGPQLVNRVVDISPTLEAKHAAMRSCRTMMTHMLREMNAALADRKLRVQALVGDQSAAVDEYIKATFDARDREAGHRHGLEFAEEFHYIGPSAALDEYISHNAVPL